MTSTIIVKYIPIFASESDRDVREKILKNWLRNSRILPLNGLEIEKGSTSVRTNTMPSSPKIIELRQILAERYPRPTGAGSFYLPTGWAPLDSLLGGGLRKGAITQLMVPNISSGGALVLHEIIAAMQDASQYVALIDSKDCFEPAADHPLLLWIRCHTILQTLKATDLLLQDGNLSLVILDFKGNSVEELRKIPGPPGIGFSESSKAPRTVC